VAWLIAHHRLEQEAADCEGSLQACSAELLLACSALEEPAIDVLQQEGSAVAAIPHVLAAAAAVTDLLAARGGASPRSLHNMWQHLQAVDLALQEELRSIDCATVRQLGQAHQQFAAACQAPASNSAEPAFLESLRLLCNQHTLASEDCKEQLLAQAETEERRHMLALKQHKAAWSAFQDSARASLATRSPASSCRSTADGNCCSDGLAEESSSGVTAHGTADGWAADEQSVFVHALHACLAPGAGGRRALPQQMAALLPSRSQEEVCAHLQWHRDEGRRRSAVKHCEAAWRHEQAAVQAAAAQLLAESEACLLASVQRLVLQLEAEASCMLSAAAAAKQRQAQEAGEVAEVQHRLPVAVAAAAKQAAQRNAAADYRSRMAQLLADHKSQLQAQAAAASAKQQAAAAASAKEAAVAAAAGRQRAQHRRQMLEQKAAARQQQATRRELRRQQQEEELQALCLQVAPLVARDACRARAATESSAAAAAVAEKRHGVFAAALSFTNDQLLADQRLKVYEALRALALHTTPAGRQAVAAARPSGPLRADMLTSEQRRGLL
jgi:hypothetical protein